MILFLVSIEIHQETYMDPLLTAAEVAERVRGQEATVRFWRATGTGPKGGNVGGRVLYKQSDVEAWIESQFAKATVG
jgi:predicted DNA-binding transcriptional regulator AlpA